MNEFIYNSLIKQKTEKFKSEERTIAAKNEKEHSGNRGYEKSDSEK